MMMTMFLLALQEHAADHGAATGGTHAPGPMAFEWLPALTSLIVFGAAFFILWRTVWPKITRALDERDRKILEEIEAAEEAREQAKAALAEYEKELADAREEANRLIQKARNDARATADELRARNESELAEMKARAQRDIAAAKESAIREIHDEAASLAATIAGRILEREISVEDQQRLVDESLSRLEALET